MKILPIIFLINIEKPDLGNNALCEQGIIKMKKNV